jgi:intein-encoded DNA endonuclease-like protein
LLQKPQDLEKLIEYNKECVAAFIRGFFDSEGSVDEAGHLTASNTDFELLSYVMDLLHRYFDIQATGPHLGKRKGTILTRRGKSYVRNSDCYYIYVKTAGLATFDKEIGLSIKRKKLRLERRFQTGA